MSIRTIWLYALYGPLSKVVKSLSIDAAPLVHVRGSISEILQGSLGVSLDGLASLGPVGRADLSVLVLDEEG